MRFSFTPACSPAFLIVYGKSGKAVMHVRFTYVFVLDKKFEILILEFRKRSISHNR